jgi:4-amino-4-deoxychorismate lyase
MSQLFKSIKVFERKLYNIVFHNRRLNETRKQLFNKFDFIDLNDVITIPAAIDNGFYKCRVIYDKAIRKIEFDQYKFKEIKTLQIVECDEIDYKFKYVDRTDLNLLFQQKNDSDDILIIKNGFVTDTSFTNIVFFDGEKWLTPNTPLLKGTKREKLIEEGEISEAEIKRSDLKLFKKALLLNAFYDFRNECKVEINRIKS